jgi:hypothetical protein
LSPFLGQEGINMLDAWLNTGMSPPAEMALLVVAVQDPSTLIFADGFESGDTAAWSSVVP